MLQHAFSSTKPEFPSQAGNNPSLVVPNSHATKPGLSPNADVWHHSHRLKICSSTKILSSHKICNSRLLAANKDRWTYSWQSARPPAEGRHNQHWQLYSNSFTYFTSTPPCQHQCCTSFLLLPPHPALLSTDFQCISLLGPQLASHKPTAHLSYTKCKRLLNQKQSQTCLSDLTVQVTLAYHTAQGENPPQSSQAVFGATEKHSSPTSLLNTTSLVLSSFPSVLTPTCPSSLGAGPSQQQTSTSQLTSKNPPCMSFQLLHTTQFLSRWKPLLLPTPHSTAEKFLGFSKSIQKEPNPTSAVTTDFIACPQVHTFWPGGLQPVLRAPVTSFPAHVLCEHIN